MKPVYAAMPLRYVVLQCDPILPILSDPMLRSCERPPASDYPDHGHPPMSGPCELAGP